MGKSTKTLLDVLRLHDINPEPLLFIFDTVFNMLSVKGSGRETLAQSPWVPEFRQRQENENTKLAVSTAGHRALEAPPPLSAHTPSPLPLQPPVFTLLSDWCHPGLSNADVLSKEVLGPEQG